MKSLVSAVVAAAALSASFGAFAQSTVTRAQVRNELVQLEQAGYKPGVAKPRTTRTTSRAPKRVFAVPTPARLRRTTGPAVHSGAPAASSNARDSIFFGQ